MAKTSLLFALFFSLAGLAAAQAATSKATSTSEQIVARHIAFMQAGKPDAAADDYAEDAVLIMPSSASPEPDVAIGSANIRKILAGFVNKENFPAIKAMVSRLESRPSGVTLMHWTQFKGTPKQVDGLDVFVVKNGKIVFQNISVNPKK